MSGQPAISKHIKVLERAGLVRRAGEMPSAGRVDSGAKPMAAATSGSSATGEFWEESYEKLDSCSTR